MPLRRLPATPLLGCAAILVDFIGLGMIAPILPAIVSRQAVGFILTAQYGAVVVGQIAVGALADRVGRRLVIVGVMSLDAVFFAASGFTTNATSLIVLRLLAGFAAPVALGISYVAAVSQHLPPARAQFNFALVGVSFNLGSLIGAATGGLLGAELWLPANLVSGIVPALVAIWALFSQDTPEDAAKRRRGRGGDRAAPTAAPATADEAATGGASAAVAAASAPPEALAPAAAAPAEEPTSPAAVVVSERPGRAGGGGLRALLAAPEYVGVLLAYATQGFFQASALSRPLPALRPRPGP